MRKFIVKNRQKRKYTRKSTQTSSFSRTINAGLLPFLVMAVALITTLVISQPIREQTPAIRYSFELPELSLTSTINTIQTLPTTINQVGIAIANLLNAVVDGIKFVLSVTQHGLVAFGELCIKTVTLTITGIERLATLFMQSMAVFENIIVTDTIAVVTAITQFVTAMIDVATYITIKIVAVVILIVHIVTALTQAIATAFIHMINTIVDFILTPFRILGAFLWKFKPYVDILSAHIHMVGNDFSSGFTSIGKLTSAISPPK